MHEHRQKESTLRQAIACLAMCLTACAPQVTAPSHDPAPLTDTAGDGTPDLLRLDSPADRRAFRRWFTFLAELQFYRDPARVPREILDCAALVRFAYREALKKHDGAWASALDLDTVPAESSVQKYVYPATPLGANLFRIKPGRFLPADLAGGAFAQFADASNLRRFNSHFVTREIHDAQPVADGTVAAVVRRVSDVARASREGYDESERDGCSDPLHWAVSRLVLTRAMITQIRLAGRVRGPVPRSLHCSSHSADRR